MVAESYMLRALKSRRCFVQIGGGKKAPPTGHWTPYIRSNFRRRRLLSTPAVYANPQILVALAYKHGSNAARRKTMSISRRDFVKDSTLTAIGTSLALSSGPFAGKVLGANEKITVGVIGCGSQGRWDMRDFLRQPDVQIAAVCDVYEANLNQARELTDGKAALYKDFRKLLEQKDIDAVIIATPDHWHAMPSIHACDAGKDVYVEKPLSHTIQEGRKMVEAARRNKRIVQMGTQQRSGKHFQQAVDIVRSGKLGKVVFARTWNYSNELPQGIGNPPDTDPLPGLDWDMWLGPAPYVHYNRNRCLGNFRWFWDYAGGKLTDWGTHLIDVVHWAMDVDAPTTVYAAGAKYYIQDNRETPDNLEVIYEYPGFMMNYSNRIVNGYGIDGRSYGIQFQGTQGTLFVDRSGFEFTPELQRVGDESAPPAEKPFKGEGSPQHLPHVRNFLDCVKSRQAPASEIEIGHRSTTAALLGNIALKVKQKITWDAKKEQIVGNTEAAGLLTKQYRSPWKLA
jgi:predicted dehydrogenase